MVKGKPEDIEVYEEIRATLSEDDRIIFDAVSLGVFSEAYRALRKEMYQQSKTVSALNIEEFAQKALELHDMMSDYERLLVDLNSSLQPYIAFSVSLENGDVLDNAFSNFLKLRPTFTYKELMEYFEERYSEKRLLKYVGSIPIYKKSLIFDRKDIDARLIDLIKRGVVHYAGNGKSKKKDRELPTRFDKDKFVSMPVVYGIFAGSWNPLAVYPEIEEVHRETSKVLCELMSTELETNQAGKLLRILFKDSSTYGLIDNLAGILSMYYEQMGEQPAEFITATPEGFTIQVGRQSNEFYETVVV